VGGKQDDEDDIIIVELPRGGDDTVSQHLVLVDVTANPTNASRRQLPQQ
jgi:hypothetical protein